MPIATVEYSITGDNSGPFKINSQNGQVSVIDGSVLDYETAASYTFTAMCTDTANVTITATAQVNITLLPVNEFQPAVSPSGLTVTSCIKKHRFQLEQHFNQEDSNGIQ